MVIKIFKGVVFFSILSVLFSIFSPSSFSATQGPTTTCPVRTCTYSQDDGDISTRIECFTGVCTDENNCDFNTNCVYDGSVPAACRIGAKVSCPNPTGTDPTCAGNLGAQVCQCGDNDQPCCQSKINPGFCKGTNYATKRQDGACYCQSWDAAASPAPKNIPCAPGQFIDGNCKAIPTGLGFNIETEPAAFMRRVFSILLSLAGGIALILIIFSGYRLMTSQGNPEAIQGARETLTSAIVGLLFIIFSFLVFTVITTDILRIPFISK